MAIYHCSIKIIGRSGGRSAVGSSAYRAGEKLEDKETGMTHDYTRKNGVVYNEVMLPNHAPAEYQNREKLWNEVQKVEKQNNAQLAREIEVGLPREMSREQQIQCVRDYVQNNFAKEGMCADFAIHDKGNGNPHAHIMLTTRGIKENGKWDAKEKKVLARDENGERIPVIDPKTGQQKIRDRGAKGIEFVWKRETVKANDWNDRSRAEEWRKAWAEECNKYLSQERKIDHRSYARQGIDQTPTIHEGYKARKMEQEGAVSDRCEINRQIKEYNAIQKTVAKLQESRENIASKVKEKVREINGEIQRIRNDLRARVGRDAGRDAGAISELARDAGRKRTYEIATREHERAERGTQQGKCKLEQRERQAQSGYRETQCGERQAEWRERESQQREQQAQPRESVPARQSNEQTVEKTQPQEQTKAEPIVTEEERTLDRLYQEYKQAYQSYDKAVSQECRCGFFDFKKKKECKEQVDMYRRQAEKVENELAKYGIQREWGIDTREKIKSMGEKVRWKKQEIQEQSERRMKADRPKFSINEIEKEMKSKKQELSREKGQEKSRTGFDRER